MQNLDEYLEQWRKDLENTKSFKGAVDPYFDRMEAEYRAFLKSNKPMLKSEYYALSKEQQAAERKRQGGVIIWQGNFTSRSGVKGFLTSLYKRFASPDSPAARDREEQRANAKWTGPKHLTAPDKTRYAFIGHRWDWWTGPDDWRKYTNDRLKKFRM